MEPSFQCQMCRAKLNFTGNFEPIYENKPVAISSTRQSTMMHGSVFDTARVEESFIVLDQKRPAGVRPGAEPGQNAGNFPNRGLEESFVVLGSASLIRPPAQPSTYQPAQQVHSEGSVGVPLDAKFHIAEEMFELASSSTHIDHPLCLDCASQLKDEIDAQIQEAEREIASYSAAFARLEAENLQPWSPTKFEQELQAAVQEEEGARTEVEHLESELADVERQLSNLRAEAREVDQLEEQYWHDFNAYYHQLKEHVEERDGLLNKIDRASQRLQLLKTTNVYNDAFRIWHDGPFGTISNFRLGRTQDVQVEWDEINAAWGQAVLLLHTMAQSCHLTFSSSRLLPMGSHPRIADKRGVYDLFGPVNKIWSSNYDRAMICFLSCLKEFGEFAQTKDRQEKKDHPFEFPFPIEGDRVGNHTIKLTLNKDVKWTRALKYMLADLKLALQWMVKREAQDLPVLPRLGPEGPQREMGIAA